MSLALALRRSLVSGAARQAACSSLVSLREFRVPSASTWQQEGREADEARRASINRMLYRSRQRGWLELDLLVGMWAERSLPHLSGEELADFEEVLALENPDLFKWLTGQLEAPSELQRNRAYKLIADHVKEMLDANSTRAAQSTSGAEWKRGWDDWKGGSLEKPAEGQEEAK